LLDQHVGFFPHVTRTNTGLKNIHKIILGTDIEEPEVYLVTRAYQTRHGNGFMPHQYWAHAIKENPYETNVDTTYQGRFRRTVLDLDLLAYGISAHKIDTSNATLVITCLDLLPNNEFKLAESCKVIDYKNKFKFINRIDQCFSPECIWLSHSPYTQRIETGFFHKGR
jgi:adenylosuccinate synthase